MYTLLFLLCLSYFCLPALTFWLCTVSSSNSLENIIDGVCFSFSLSVCSIFFLSLIHLNLYFIVWIIPTVWSLYYCFGNRVEFNKFKTLEKSTKWLLFLLLLSAIVRFLPAYYDEYPQGWDPYFHLLLVEKIITAQTHIYDWLPYETIPLNYPIGTHLFIASISKLSAIPSHIVFKFLISFFGTLTCAQVYSLIKKASNDSETALYGTASFSLLAQVGSLDYYGWGGLPNLLGIYFFLGSLTILIDDSYPDKIKYALPVFFVGISVVNHHSLLSAVLLLLVILIYLLAKKTEKRKAHILLVSALISLFFGLYTIIPKIFNKYEMSETGLLTYQEQLHTLDFISENVGHQFLVFTILGVCIYFALRKSIKINHLLILSNISFITLFITFEYGARVVTGYFGSKSIAPFTSSRFLCNATPLLAVFPGLFWSHFKRITNKSTLWIMRLIFLFALFNYSIFLSDFVTVINDDYKAAYIWIKNNTSLDTVVLDKFVHAPLVTQRVSYNTPIPTSELWSRAEKKKLMDRIIRNEIPPSSMNVPVVVISEKNQSNFPNAKIIWKHPTSDLFIIEIYSGDLIKN